MKKYIIYEAGWRAEKFLHENKSIRNEVVYCIDSFQTIPCFVDVDHPSNELMRIVGRQVAELLKLNDIYKTKLSNGGLSKCKKMSLSIL